MLFKKVFKTVVAVLCLLSFYICINIVEATPQYQKNDQIGQKLSVQEGLRRNPYYYSVGSNEREDSPEYIKKKNQIEIGKPSKEQQERVREQARNERIKEFVLECLLCVVPALILFVYAFKKKYPLFNLIPKIIIIVLLIYYRNHAYFLKGTEFCELLTFFVSLATIYEIGLKKVIALPFYLIALLANPIESFLLFDSQNTHTLTYLTIALLFFVVTLYLAKTCDSKNVVNENTSAFEVLQTFRIGKVFGKAKSEDIERSNVRSFCTNCGEKIPQDIVFCPYCGVKIIQSCCENDTVEENSSASSFSERKENRDVYCSTTTPIPNDQVNEQLVINDTSDKSDFIETEETKIVKDILQPQPSSSMPPHVSYQRNVIDTNTISGALNTRPSLLSNFKTQKEYLPVYKLYTALLTNRKIQFSNDVFEKVCFYLFIVTMEKFRADFFTDFNKSNRFFNFEKYNEKQDEIYADDQEGLEVDDNYEWVVPRTDEEEDAFAEMQYDLEDDARWCAIMDRNLVKYHLLQFIDVRNKIKNLNISNIEATIQENKKIISGLENKIDSESNAIEKARIRLQKMYDEPSFISMDYSSVNELQGKKSWIEHENDILSFIDKILKESTPT